MNNCEVVRDLIPMYVDKTASEETVIMVQNHVETCADCRKFADSCMREDKKRRNVIKDKVFYKKSEEQMDIDDMDRQYAALSKKLKRRKIRQLAIGLLVLVGMMTYVIVDVAKVVNRNKNK